jgi:N-acetylneuraminic acid mutarotase
MMKKILGQLWVVLIFLILFSACQTETPVSTYKWTWVSGSNIAGQAGTYGTKGVADPSNVPGARMRASSWLDSGGKLWLFGGSGYDSAGFIATLNDLWEFDPATLEWTWVSGSNLRYESGAYGTKGVAAPSNVPGARYSAVSWIDSQGKLWLFGGYGYDSVGNFGELNDLWEYNPATLEWTWVSGSNSTDQIGVYGTKGTANSSNVPGARSGAISWYDSGGQLWLFGGSGYDSAGRSSVLNDLWKFDPGTLDWTWVSGNNTADQRGVYGTKGIPHSLSVPGARDMAVSWIDAQDKLWLFGGWGWGDNLASNVLYLNDLWKFDPATLEWTWVSGTNAMNQAGIYGTKGTAAMSNMPGSRFSSVSWVDSGGKLWLFGGAGNDSAGAFGSLNDLWEFSPTTLEWTWVSGSNLRYESGTYGTKGVAAASNVPGARSSAVSWIDSKGKLWLFGGDGYSAGNEGWLNDLWQYAR